MSALELLISLLKEFEGCRLNAYKDSGGVWTIGYGQTKGIKKGMKWTQEQAENDLLDTAMDTIKETIQSSPILANETMYKQAAIADFVYNLGITSYNKSTLKLRVDKGNWVVSATEIKRWTKDNGKILPGLVKRRQREAVLLLM